MAVTVTFSQEFFVIALVTVALMILNPTAIVSRFLKETAEILLSKYPRDFFFWMEKYIVSVSRGSYEVRRTSRLRQIERQQRWRRRGSNKFTWPDSLNKLRDTMVYMLSFNFSHLIKGALDCFFCEYY